MVTVRNWALLAAVVLTITVTGAAVPAGAVPCTTADPNQIVVSAPPADLRLGMTESDTCMLLFDEQQGVTLSSPLSAAPPSTTNAVTQPAITLTIGTVVNSYLVRVDKIGSSAAGVRYQGSHLFDNDVIGFEVTGGDLSTTNTLLGLNGAGGLTYDASGQGLEATGQPQPDRVWVDSDQRTVHFDFTTSSGADEARILTGSYPPFCTTADLNQIVVSAPPADLRLGMTESDTCIRLFDEQQGVTLSSPLSAAPPSTTNAVTQPAITLTTGTVVNSYLVRVDKIGSSAAGVRYQGSHLFDNDVIGFEVTGGDLSITNILLGVNGVGGLTYDASGQGLEATGQPQPDRVWVDSDQRTVHFDFTDSSGADEARVLTGSYPPFCTTADVNQIVVSAPPADLRLGMTESNSCIRLFEEQQGVTLTSPLSAAPPSTTDAITQAAITLPMGTVVNSYFVHADKIGSSSATLSFQGSHVFENDVIGFVVTDGGLGGTNSLLGDNGAGGLTYNASPGGLESPMAAAFPDHIWVDSDQRTVHFDFTTGASTDQARVLTGSLPPGCPDNPPWPVPIGDSDCDGFSDVAENGTPVCIGSVNDDNSDDSLVNDGCPAVGAAESVCAGSVDEDGDTFVNDGCPQSGAFSEAQFKIGTNELGPCSVGADAGPSPSWPADLAGGGTSVDKITLPDVTSFVAPAPKKLNSSPGEPGFDSRWDLVPGRGATSADMIVLGDLTALTAGPTAAPPMFGGAKVFNGPTCTGP